jgi:predicted CXXCH cytochrome family protein
VIIEINSTIIKLALLSKNAQIAVCRRNLITGIQIEVATSKSTSKEEKTMSDQTGKNRMMKSARVIMSVVLLQLVFIGDGNAFESIDSLPGKCDFSIQLRENQEVRENFLSALNKAVNEYAVSDDDVDLMYKNVVGVRGSDGGIVGVDSFSYDCIICHDGASAPLHRVRFLNLSEQKSMTIENVIGSHPIGMIYEDHVNFHRGLKGLRDLPGSMKLIGGRVGCLTCHNPMNPERYHLAVSNEGSNLCLTCHTN